MNRTTLIIAAVAMLIGLAVGWLTRPVSGRYQVHNAATINIADPSKTSYMTLMIDTDTGEAYVVGPDEKWRLYRKLP